MKKLMRRVCKDKAMPVLTQAQGVKPSACLVKLKETIGQSQ
jgi:hypothetical protein